MFIEGGRDRMSRLESGIKIWVKNREVKEGYKQGILKNLKEKNKPKRNFVLEPVQLNEVLEELNITSF